MTQRAYSTPRSEAFTWNRSGKLLTANNDVAELTFAYDALRRMTSTTQTMLAAQLSFTTTYSYVVGPDGSVRNTEYPAGRMVTDTFDLRGRLVDVTGDYAGAAWSFDAADRRTSAEMANAVSSVFDFDVNSRLTHIQHSAQGGTLFNLSFGYDALGLKTYSRDLIYTGRSELYGHDNGERLRSLQRGVLNQDNTAITTPLTDPVMPSAQGWPDLDARGNWPTLTQPVNGAQTTQTRVANGVNEYTSIDPDGPGAEKGMVPKRGAEKGMSPIIDKGSGVW